METKDKAGFGIHNQPEIMLNALNFDHCFVCMPFVGIEIERWNELQGDVLKQGSEIGTPVADGRVRYLDIHYSTQN